MKNKTSEVSKIQHILGKDKTSTDQNLAHFTVDEKCTAIENWSHSADFRFDMSFVNSAHSYYLRTGRASEKQTSALDKILSKFNIDVDKWSY